MQHKKKAFSFVEILLAVFIVGVGVVPVILLFLQGTRTVEKGSVIFQVSVAAQNLIDRARSDSFIWANIPCVIELPEQQQKYPALRLPKILEQKYKAKATVVLEIAPGHTVSGINSNETNLYQITTLIKWVENGKDKEYRLLNYRANINSFALKTSTNE